MRFISFLFPRSPLLIFGKVSSAGEREGEGDYAPSPLFPRPGISPPPLPLAWSQRRNRHHDDRLSTHNLRMPKKSSSPPRGKNLPPLPQRRRLPLPVFGQKSDPKGMHMRTRFVSIAWCLLLLLLLLSGSGGGARSGLKGALLLLLSPPTKRERTSV